MPVRSSPPRSCPGQFQNSIFTIISSQEGPSLQTQTSLKQSGPSLGQSRMCSSGASHILYICTSMNDHSRTLKQQCFKTSVGHQMVHSLSIMAKGQSNYHISQLTTSTICNYTFHVILHKSHSPPHQRSNSTNPQQYCSSNNTTFPNPGSTCNLKNTSGYQCCRVNLGGYWCRSFHPISLPNMQAYLRTFSQSSPQQGKANNIRVISRSTSCSENRSVSTSQIPPTNKQSK